uniref:Uncharacterized protein B14A6.120 n=1 Tax=Neurospora crassa TaxID=5141 RepID=Q8X0E5_NEUCS|nr:conserved hypothetical protein [Neurospora crassa]
MDTSTYSQTSGSGSPPMDDSDYTLDSRLRSFRKHFTDIKPPSALRIGPIKPLSLQPKRSTSFPQSSTPYSKPSFDSNTNTNNIDTSHTLLPPTSTTTSSPTPDNSFNLNINPSTNATNTLTRADIIRHIQLKKFLEAFVRRRKNLKTELEDRLRLLKQEAKNNRRRRQNVFFYPSSATTSTTTTAAANNGNNSSNGDINVNGMLDLQKEQRIDGLVEERIRLAHETYEQQLALLINEFVVVGLREEVLRVI